jgi:2-Cys peroxiredoxin 5
LGDPTGKFSEALDVSFDSVSIFGNQRSKRYALLVEDGKVKEAFVEPDNTGVKGNCLVPALSEDIDREY